MKYILFIGFLIKALIVTAQSDLFSSSSLSKDVLIVEAYDVSMKKIPMGTLNVEGSQMLQDEFVKGEVKFKTGQVYNNVPLNLSLLNNQLYFIKDNLVLQFLNPVDYFAIPVGDMGKEKTLTFKSGYPDIGINRATSFYQVVTGGSRVQLLKFLSKTVQQIYHYNSPTEKVYALKERLYVFDILTKKIFELKATGSFLKDALPAYAYYINTYASHKKLNLRHEEELIALIEYINGQR